MRHCETLCSIRTGAAFLHIQNITGKWLHGPEVAEIVKMSILEALVGFSAFSLHQCVLKNKGGGKKKPTPIQQRMMARM